MKTRKRWLLILLIILLCISPAMAEIVDSAEVDVYDGEIVLVEDETDGAAPDEVEIDLDQVEESVDEDITLLDMLDTDLLVMEDESVADEALDVASNAVSNDAPSGIKNNGEGGIYIDINASPYTDFAQKSYGSYAYGRKGCAWFASARLCQVTGIDCIISSGTSWYNERYAWYDLERGTSFPSSGKALVCYGGHVSVIEKVDGDQALVSEGGEYISSDAAHGYCVIHWMDISAVKSRLGGAIGYVYFGRQAVASGQCGDDVYWDLYEDKVLEIHGSGAMWEYDDRDAPWKEYSWSEEYEAESHDGQINIERVIIDEGITSIGMSAFSGMYMTSVSIPNSVTKLGTRAFLGCEELREIGLPDGITIIPESAFDECISLEKVKLPNELRIIERAAFWKTRLRVVDFPDTLEEIQEAAFSNSFLEELYIPRNVSYIDPWAFERNSIAKIQVDNNNKAYNSINNVLYTKNQETLVLCAQQKMGTFAVPEGVKYIGAAAFNCTNLSNITFPDGVLSIGTYAFEMADKLKSINLPKSLVSIDDHAFIYCEYGGTLSKLTVYVGYGSYALKYCRAHDIKHAQVQYPDEEGYLEKYIITMNLSKTGSNGRVTLRKGEKIQLIPVSKKGNLTIKSCKTNYSKVAKVNNKGVVTAVGKGESKITVQPKGLKAMTLTVKVIDPYTPTGVKLNKSGTVKLAIGKTLQLKATVSPDTAETTLTWSSSNSKIAKVSKNGKVTGVKKGTATITVKTKNGKTAKVKIKVEKGSGGGGGGGGW